MIKPKDAFHAQGGVMRRIEVGVCQLAVLFIASFSIIAFSNNTWACGKWRWSVKTGTDQDAQQIDVNNIVQSSIASLTSIPLPVRRPTWNAYPQSSRIAPTEDTVFNIHATIYEIRREADDDIHLVVRDSSGNTMDTEIPSPSCVGSSSPFLPLIQAARSYVTQNWSGSERVNIPASITGVGFFDIPHAGGAARNGIEIHPILQIKFLNQ